MNSEKLLAALENGVPLTQRPFADIAEKMGEAEANVIAGIRALSESGVIRRFGAVVKHRELGFTSNAMCVWNIPDEKVQEIGRRMVGFPFVTLCYRRRRSLPAWPYNLYCMIHGQERFEVTELFETLTRDLELTSYDRKMLLSPTCFKQRGARYFSDEKEPLSDLDRKVIGELQHGIAVSEKPFEKPAAKLGLKESELLCRLSELKERGHLSRFGPMFNVEKFGGNFVLVAMKVPQVCFDEVAAIVNSFPEVAHNYEREHELNMWFVVATESEAETKRVLDEIEMKTALKTYSLPKEKEFFLELKFDT